jgi:hypothetical protein
MIQNCRKRASNAFPGRSRHTHKIELRAFARNKIVKKYDIRCPPTNLKSVEILARIRMSQYIPAVRTYSTVQYGKHNTTQHTVS